MHGVVHVGAIKEEEKMERDGDRLVTPKYMHAAAL